MTSIRPHEGLQYLTPDELAETVSGISMPTYQHLWAIVCELDEQRKGAPVGGDHHDPRGEFGPPMVEDPYSRRDVVMEGQGNVTSIWKQLTESEQREINAAMKARDAEWESFGATYEGKEES